MIHVKFKYMFDNQLEFSSCGNEMEHLGFYFYFYFFLSLHSSFSLWFTIFMFDHTNEVVNEP
jgi:hypothetical protein